MADQDRDALRDVVQDALQQDMRREEAEAPGITERLVAETLTTQSVTTRTDSTQTHTALTGSALTGIETAHTLEEATRQEAQALRPEGARLESLGPATLAASTGSQVMGTQTSSTQSSGTLHTEARHTETTRLSADGRQIVEQLRLHEERAEVDILRERAGQVQIRRVVVERQETLPVTLRRELVEITVKEGGDRVLLNGEELEPGRTYELEVYEERAEVVKRVYPFQDVTIAKQAQTFTHDEEVTLRREELDVERIEVPGDVLQVERIQTTTDRTTTDPS